MLKRIGVDTIDELLASVPGSLRQRAGLKLPDSLDERRLLEYAQGLAAQNRGTEANSSFLGAAAYHHHVRPAEYWSP